MNMTEDFSEDQGQEAQSQKQKAIDHAEMQLVNKKAEMTDLIINGDESEKYIAAANKLKEIALRLTKPTDWVKFGEGVYLQDQRTAELNTYMQSLFGLNVTILSPKMEKESYKKKIVNKYKGTDGKDREEEVEIDVIEYTYTGGVLVEEVKEIPGRIRRQRTIEPIMGSCSTADEMFGKVNGVQSDPKYIQPSKIMKKAQANYRGNCMRYLWGLKGTTEEDLAKVFSKEDMAKVKDSTVRGAAQYVNEDDAEGIQELRLRILRAHDNDAKASRAFLQKCTAFEGKNGKSDFPGYTDINRVKLNSFPHKKIIAALEKIEKEKGYDHEAPKHEKNANAKPVENKKLSEYEQLLKDIAGCKSTQDVLAIESIAKRNDVSKALTPEQREEIRDKIGLRYRELDKHAEQTDDLPY